jgi:hypothetical protein
VETLGKLAPETLLDGGDGRWCNGRNEQQLRGELGSDVGGVGQALNWGEQVNWRE